MSSVHTHSNKLINKYSNSTGSSHRVNNISRSVSTISRNGGAHHTNYITSDKDNSHTTKIPTVQIVKKTDDKINMKVLCEEVNDRYFNSLEEYWKKRTNQPYKNILYDHEYKPIVNEKDLIISNTKNIKKIGTDQVKEYTENIEKHNNELKNIYSKDKKQEHFKQFEFNLKHKRRITGPVTDDQNSLKKNRILFYQKEQEKLDQSKVEGEKILSGLLKEGIFNADELKAFGGIDVKGTTNNALSK